LTDSHTGRTAFGGRLRALRLDAELSGKELAGRLGWPASKVSRLEHGRQTTSADDVARWTEAVGCPGEIRAALLADLRSMRVEYATWRRPPGSATHIQGSASGTPWGARFDVVPSYVRLVT
jgi:transcriptional regulator with XRE-family HTH domain